LRIVTHRESTYIGRCIYCGASDVRLGEEHVSPFGLNGLIILLDASCGDCAKVTSQVEFHVLRHMWGAARAWMGYRSRHPNPKRYAQKVIRNGEKETIIVPLSDALKIIELPIFKAPSALLGQGYADRIECVSKDQFVLVESINDLTRRLCVDEICPPEFDPEIFARFIAKVSYGYAIERYGWEAFESIYLRSAILGTTTDIGRWVGSPESREFRICNTPMSGGFKILPDNDVLVRVKLFPRFDGAEYVAVVGKLRSFFADQYRLVGKAS